MAMDIDYEEPTEGQDAYFKMKAKAHLKFIFLARGLFMRGCLFGSSNHNFMPLLLLIEHCNSTFFPFMPVC